MMMSKLRPSRCDGSWSSTSSAPHQSQMLNVTPYLTEDLLSQILDRLPVKTLLQCRCVCKPWCSLIDSPCFVKAHLKRSNECNADTSLLIRGFVICSVDFEDQYNATAKEIDEPLKSLLYGTGLVGTCDGLLCLYNQKPDIFLWNPATRKCKKLPAAPTGFRCPFDYDRSSQLCGFGYDVVNDDYKVLRMFQPGGSDLSGSKVTIYGLKTNSWKRLENIPSHFELIEAWGVFMCGALHWVTFKTLESCFVILAFDLGVETYREVPFPNLENKNPDQFTLTIFEESLCMLYYDPFIHIDLWVMNDYGIGNSWCKLFTLEHPKVIRSGMDVRPIVYSKSRRDVLWESDNKVIWYNLENKKVKTLKIANLPDEFNLSVYKESLVSPEFGFSCDGQHLPKQHEKKKKQRQAQKKRDNFLAKGFKLVL
nr:PREDICTED: F-box protein CPR30-like isoform X2 [Daucus carota subsp. sativus]